LEIGAGGGVNACCSGWLAAIVGWMRSQSLEEIWNGEKLGNIRSKIASGDYSSCSALLCPYFHDKTRGEPNRRFPVYEPSDTERPSKESAPAPLSLHLCNDSSCSLSCPSCRTRTIIAGRSEYERINAFFMPQIQTLLPHLKRIWITGSGDPFASRHYRDLLDLLKTPSHRHIVIDMQTNGVLFDEREWNRFDLDGRMGTVIVSIDSGKRETYSRVRIGGDWDRLMQNLAFLGRKREQNHIKHLRLDVVTQACNFREIPDVVEIVEEKGFDQAYFSILTNWGHLTWENFCGAFVFSSDHPDFKYFCTIYDELRHHPRIDWGNIPRWTSARP
jgi:hypothetical protein